MTTRTTLRVLGLLGLVFFLSNMALARQPSAGSGPIGAQRAKGLMRILSAPPEQQRAFVQENFTTEAIARRGLDGVVTFLAQVHKDLGDRPIPRALANSGARHIRPPHPARPSSTPTTATCCSA